jgi:phosphomevalonate kinase
MQSMSVGTPVIISKTIGFWDNFNFKDNENIYFVSKNELNDWVIKVKNVLFDTESLEGAKKNSKELILYKFQQKYFDKFMYDMLLG